MRFGDSSRFGLGWGFGVKWMLQSSLGQILVAKRPSKSPTKDARRGRFNVVLRDLRYVYRNPTRTMTTEARKRWRQLFEENFDAFVTRLQEEEYKHLKEARERLKAAKQAGPERPLATPEIGNVADSPDPDSERMKKLTADFVEECLGKADRRLRTLSDAKGAGTQRPVAGRNPDGAGEAAS